MGAICVSKQNRDFDEHETVHLNAFDNNSMSSTASSSMSFIQSTNNDSKSVTSAFIFQILKTHNLPAMDKTVSDNVSELCTVYCGSMDTCINPLVIHSGETLKLNDQKPLRYSSILLEKNATLTINRWNPKQRSGGLLKLEVFGDLTMESGSKITVSGRGYTGGNYGRNGGVL